MHADSACKSTFSGATTIEIAGPLTRVININDYGMTIIRHLNDGVRLDP